MRCYSLARWGKYTGGAKWYTCAHCGKRFKRRPAWVRWDNAYCSRACFQEHLSEEADRRFRRVMERRKP